MEILKKTILVLIALGVASSLILSNACTGPIDSIFIGWRDLTKCSPPGGHFFSTEHLRQGGVYILLLLLIILVAVMYLYKIFIINRKK